MKKYLPYLVFGFIVILCIISLIYTYVRKHNNPVKYNPLVTVTTGGVADEYKNVVFVDDYDITVKGPDEDDLSMTPFSDEERAYVDAVKQEATAPLNDTYINVDESNVYNSREEFLERNNATNTESEYEPTEEIQSESIETLAVIDDVFAKNLLSKRNAEESSAGIAVGVYRSFVDSLEYTRAEPEILDCTKEGNVYKFSYTLPYVVIIDEEYIDYETGILKVELDEVGLVVGLERIKD